MWCFAPWLCIIGFYHYHLVDTSLDNSHIFWYHEKRNICEKGCLNNHELSSCLRSSHVWHDLSSVASDQYRVWSWMGFQGSCLWDSLSKKSSPLIWPMQSLVSVDPGWDSLSLLYRKYFFCLFILYHIPSDSMLCAFLYRTRKIRKTSRLIIVVDCCNNDLSGLEYISLCSWQKLQM